MAIVNITQPRRIVFRKYDTSSSAWETFTLNEDDLGQDTVVTFNIAPRKKSRASQKGSTETPIPGTFDSLSASITMIADNWFYIGRALENWTAATYDGATTGNGQALLGTDETSCSTDYYSVIVQGICDDGSSADVEFTRCIPSMDDDIELGTSDAAEVTVNLNPIIYNSTTHADDGYPEYTIRLGDYDTATKMRLNPSTGVYAAVES